ncbi:MAG TPA: enoyl-CoA hydratase/isomerase family protein [Aeromicrobium sp.]|nr:enoyl-CoA hydratase/isomerase family protein [Aeromicrobium sp.]
MVAGSYRGFDVEVDDAGVALFRFGHPERLNAMSFGTRRDLIECIMLAQVDDSVRVMVFTGDERSFCAGAYLPPDYEDAQSLGGSFDDVPARVSGVPASAHVPVNLQNRLRVFAQELVRTVRRSDKLTIAAVDGYAIQIGFSLALACDYAVAGPTAKMGSATLRMGYMPDEGGHWLLVEHLGVKRALDFMLRSRIVDADEALRLGLVSEVAEAGQTVERAMEIAHELARGPQVAMRLLKRSTYAAAQLSFDAAGEDIALRTALSDFHADTDEGHKAWRQKREAHFNAWLEPT